MASCTFFQHGSNSRPPRQIPFLNCTFARRHCTATYHHLVYGVHDIVHLVSGDEAVIVHIVQPERPCNIQAHSKHGATEMAVDEAASGCSSIF